ncbi:SDR family oxidoreductase [Rugosimonospora acidiphila]|uniref:SDR family oxidoreductase n=1 Tax=Rugosimonospora acidiphila TaxID=556531 RepID=A0ABP9S717_9ACTN
MDLGLDKRVYIVTGGSRGLGFAAAQCLVADGAQVVISARDPDRLDDAVQRLGGPRRAAGLAVDLGDPAAATRLVDRAVDAFGGLDGALVSVGGPMRGSTIQISDDQWRAAFDTVFLGTVRLARTVAERLPAGGAIAFVLASSARTPLPGVGLSNGLRPGLAAVAKEMADEYGPRGIRVVSLLPYRIETERNRELWAATGDLEAARRQTEASIPLGRVGQPDEFGRVAAFLLSPAAGYLTGLSVPIDGGALRTP